jgi:CubicO group peptidase (beta-lactamase class C family)
MVLKQLFRPVLTTVFFSFGIFLFGQTAADSIVREFNQAAASLVLLKNDNGLVPLKRLDTMRIATLAVGLANDNDFSKFLQKYTLVEELPFPGVSAPASPTEWAEEYGQKYDLIIFGIADGGSSDRLPDYLKMEAYLRAMLFRQKTIVAIFGGDRILNQFSWLDQSDALIVTPQSPWSESLAAQLVFGGVGASGRLERDLGASFKTGAGIAGPGGIRLRYSPPEVVNMNRALMEDSIRTIVEEGIQKKAFPGAQVLVAKDGHVVYHEAFGFHTYDSLHPLMTTDIYDFASVTKVSSGLPILMKLHGEGKFDLDTPLGRYLPDFGKTNKADLTFRALLTHSSRLMSWIPFWKGTLRKNARYPWKKRWDPSRINDFNFRAHTFAADSSARFPVKVTDNLWLHFKFKEKRLYGAIKKSPLNEKPGYVYSDLFFTMMPEVAKNLTGTDFETYLKQTFYRPLGATTLTYNPWRFYSFDRIVPTERDTFFRMVQIHGRVHDEGAAMLGGVSGHAGLFGSANDLAKLFQMYLNFGVYGGERFIDEKSLREFTRCQYCDQGIRRGLGFDKPLIEYDFNNSHVAEDASPSSFGHSGYTGTFAWADPQSNLLFIFFSNRVYPTRDNPRISTLNIRPRIHQVLYDAMKGEGSR